MVPHHFPELHINYRAIISPQGYIHIHTQTQHTSSIYDWNWSQCVKISIFKTCRMSKPFLMTSLWCGKKGESLSQQNCETMKSGWRFILLGWKSGEQFFTMIPRLPAVIEPWKLLFTMIYFVTCLLGRMIKRSFRGRFLGNYS